MSEDEKEKVGVGNYQNMYLVVRSLKHNNEKIVSLWLIIFLRLCTRIMKSKTATFLKSAAYNERLNLENPDSFDSIF